MPWFKVDDDFHDHPKARNAGPFAVGVWVLCGGWSADNLTDGYVPDQVVREKGGRNWPRAARALVAVGLWYRVDGPPETLLVDDVSQTGVTSESVSRRDWGPGYQFHDWHRYQPTRDDWTVKREADAARQRRSRERRKAGRHGVTSDPGREVNGATRDRRREAVSHHPDPYVPTGRHGERASDVNGTDAEHTNINASSPKPTPPGWRDPAVERLLAETRAKLRPGRPLRNAPPVDPNPKGGA